MPSAEQWSPRSGWSPAGLCAGSAWPLWTPVLGLDPFSCNNRGLGTEQGELTEPRYSYTLVHAEPVRRLQSGYLAGVELGNVFLPDAVTIEVDLSWKDVNDLYVEFVQFDDIESHR